MLSIPMMSTSRSIFERQIQTMGNFRFVLKKNIFSLRARSKSLTEEVEGWEELMEGKKPKQGKPEGKYEENEVSKPPKAIKSQNFNYDYDETEIDI